MGNPIRRNQKPKEVLEYVVGFKQFVRRVGVGLSRKAWIDLMGEEIALHAIPLRVRKGILHIGVDSAAWAQELQFHGNLIVEKMNKAFPEKEVVDIRTRVFAFNQHKKGEKKVSSLPELDDFDFEKIGKLVETIEDDELEAALKQAYGRSLQLRKREANKRLKENK